MQIRWFAKLSKHVPILLVASLLVVLVVSQTPVSAIDSFPSDLNVGPYVDKIV